MALARNCAGRVAEFTDPFETASVFNPRPRLANYMQHPAFASILTHDAQSTNDGRPARAATFRAEFARGVGVRGAAPAHRPRRAGKRYGRQRAGPRAGPWRQPHAGPRR